MRKFYFLLAGLFFTLFSFAQSANQVNFTFTVNPIDNQVTFTNTSILQSDSLPKKAFWSLGDGTSTIMTPLSNLFHYYQTSGTYTVCLKIYRYNNANWSDSTLLGDVCKVVTIQQTCLAGFQWRDTFMGNPPTRFVQFNGFGQNNANSAIKEVCWNFGDGSDTCILASPTNAYPLYIHHSYASNGSYNVCIRVKFNNGCVAEKCDTIRLNSTPIIADSCAANFVTQPITATPLGRKFVAQPWHNKGKKPVLVCWQFGDGKDTCIQYAASYTGDYWVEHRFAQASQYNACVKIRYEGGCEKTTCNVIQISAPTPPQDSCTASVNEVATSPSNLERKFYVGLMQNKVAEKICWTFGDGTDTCIILSTPFNPQQLSVAHLYPAPGNYTVCAKVFYAGGCVVQRCKQTSIPLSSTNICGGYMTDSAASVNTIRFKGTGIHAPNDYVVSYGWILGDGTTATGQVVNHTYNVTGRYNVCLIIRTNSGCETKICKAVNVASGNQAQLILTPNPVITILNATFHSTLQQTMTVKIFNANGVAIKNYTLNAMVGANNWTFSDVGTLPTGIYSVTVQSPNQFASATFFKQ